MKFLKLITTRNPFSREYGTWLIVLFNLLIVPTVFQEVNNNTVLFGTSVIFFLLFRFELIDYFSIKIQHSQRNKFILALCYLSISGIIFHFIGLGLSIELSMGSIGIGLTVFNVFTRRKKGKRQSIISQIILIAFISLLGAFNYYLLFDKIDESIVLITLISFLFFTNSIVFVRSKTVGAPYHLLSLIYSILSIILAIVFGQLLNGHSYFALCLIPSLIKSMDNVILENYRVHLRRIGINESFHSTLFIYLLYLINSFI